MAHGCARSRGATTEAVTDDNTTQLDVVPATAHDLQLLRDDPDGFTAARGWRVEPGFLEFEGALDMLLTMLDSGIPPEWATYLFVHRADAAVVGIGGFKGPPVDGVVEIGYSIAPTYRRRGLATEAAAQMTATAARAGVAVVCAHTLAEDNPSTRVLRRLGFVRTDEVPDADGIRIWRWELPAHAARSLRE